MRNKMKWGIATLIIFIGAASVFFIKSEMDFAAYKKQAESQYAKNKAWFEKQKEQEQIGHYHDDGTWHAGTHADHAPSAEMPKETPIVVSDVQATDAQVSSNASKGTSLYSRVVASDKVPKYAALKAMNQDELSDLIKASHAKAKSYDLEVNRLWDAWSAVPVASDEGEALEASLDAVLKEQFVHSITGRKAFKVFQWRSIGQLQDNPLPNLIIMPVAEPFNP